MRRWMQIRSRGRTCCQSQIMEKSGGELIYRGGEGGDAGHEGGGGSPAASGEDAVESGDGEWPEEGELEPEEAAEECRRLGHEVVVELRGVPPLEVPQRHWKEGVQQDMIEDVLRNIID